MCIYIHIISKLVICHSHSYVKCGRAILAIFIKLSIGENSEDWPQGIPAPPCCPAARCQSNAPANCPKNGGNILF